MIPKILLILLLLACWLSTATAAPIPDSQFALLKNQSPLVAFRILFRTGSSDDPAGKEGIAALTASMIAEAGTQKNDYPQILKLLFPMAASYSDQVDKDLVVITGVTHRDNLMPYYQLLRDAVLTPAFKNEDFNRLKTDQLNYVTKTLRFNDDEELGKSVLVWQIYGKHPYGLPVLGVVSSVSNLTLQDVRNFYKTHFTKQRVQIGVAGDFPQSLIDQMKQDFSALPDESSWSAKKLPEPEKFQGMHVVIVEKQTPATAISFGFPISITRADDDFYPLMVFSSWFGQHRNEFSHLYQVMRQARGLNYGDYSYIEHFAYGGRFMQPPPNYARRQQIFQIWIRPVPNATRHFALREAIRELDMIVNKGMTRENFELARNFLTNFSVNLAQSNLEQLGYALDDRFYGLSQPFLEHMRSGLQTLTVEDVNRAIRKHLNAQNLKIAIVTQDAAGLKEALVQNKPSPIQYDSPKPDAITQEDQIIMKYPLSIRDEDVTIIPASKVFE
jgi:zinc protease